MLPSLLPSPDPGMGQREAPGWGVCQSWLAEPNLLPLSPASEGTLLSPGGPTELPLSGSKSGPDLLLCPRVIPAWGEAMRQAPLSDPWGIFHGLIFFQTVMFQRTNRCKEAQPITPSNGCETDLRP